MRSFVERLHDDVTETVGNNPVFKDVSTQTNDSSVQIEEELAAARERIAALELEVKSYEQKLEKQKFRIGNMVEDHGKLAFYTGFQTFGALEAFYKYRKALTFRGPYISRISRIGVHPRN